jgi:hypothetical protein
MIDARDYLASRARTRREQFAPEGPVVAFSGGQEWHDHELLWDRLDQIAKRIPEMVLATTAQAKGCDAIATAWAASRGIKVVQFKLDRSQGNRAAFVRNDRIVNLKPVEAIVCEARASSPTSPRSCAPPAFRFTSSAAPSSALQPQRDALGRRLRETGASSPLPRSTCARGHRTPGSHRTDRTAIGMTLRPLHGSPDGPAAVSASPAASAPKTALTARQDAPAGVSGFARRVPGRHDCDRSHRPGSLARMQP